jgi:hypothetical protein
MRSFLFSDPLEENTPKDICDFQDYNTDNQYYRYIMGSITISHK